MQDVPSPAENDFCHAFMLYDPRSTNTTSSLDKQHSVFCCENDKEREIWLFNIGNEILKYRPKDRLIMKELSDIDSKTLVPMRSSSKELVDSKRTLNHPGLMLIADQVGEISLSPSKKKIDSDFRNPIGKYFKNKGTFKVIMLRKTSI